MRIHGSEPRGSKRVPLSPISEGRFGRMFRRLRPATEYSDDQLTALAEQMREPEPTPGGTPGGWGHPGAPAEDGDNPAIASGYTYFGQFVDHDITFDPTSQLGRTNDPDALRDFRTPRFDLDSLYGSGPADEPFQYDKNEPGALLLGESNGQPDLPRNSQGIALIGDPRNDENIIVSQLQLVFLRFHNKVLRDIVVPNTAIAVEDRLDETQRLVRWHYQWVIARDYLPRTCGRELIDQLFELDHTSGQRHVELRYYDPKNDPYMPVEFSGAAFRFGHSQIRAAYNLSDAVPDRPVFLPGDAVGELDDLRGNRPLPLSWTIDWRMFLPIDGSTPQPSRRIDAKLTPGLFDLPRISGDQSLALRNLKRSQALGLPSGQDVARFLGVTPRTGAELGTDLDPTPLWFYILKESELEDHRGERLGKVGARIVAEVLLGLLAGDKLSYINVEPGWQPAPPIAPEPGRFELGDLVRYATT